VFFFSLFVEIMFLATWKKRLANLVKFTLEKQIFPNFFVEISPGKKKRCLREKSISLVVFQVPSLGCKVTNNYNRCLQILHDQIAELRAKGKFFKFAWFIERRRRISRRRDVSQGLKDKYYWAVILALVIFSTIILLCCIIVLCGPHRYHPGS
jgi:hypothetical protein